MTPLTLERKKIFDTYQTVLSEVQVLTPRNKGFYFSLLDGKSMEFKPGQFVQVFVPLKNGKEERTAYSIASAPEGGKGFELCVTLVPGGESSGYLHSLSAGSQVKIMGPFGHFTLPSSLERDLVFIATGSGIAPFRSMIHYLLSTGFERNIYLVFGNRFDDDVIYQKEWVELESQHPNFKVLQTLSRSTDEWKGYKGYVQDWISTFVPNPSVKDFYICGLNKMITDVQKKLIGLGVPSSQIHYERYD